jgi:hypothetical protein
MLTAKVSYHSKSVIHFWPQEIHCVFFLKKSLSPVIKPHFKEADIMRTFEQGILEILLESSKVVKFKGRREGFPWGTV